MTASSGEEQKPHGSRSVDVHTRESTATLSLRGGNLVSWCPTGAEPVIWSPENQGPHDHGGIPLCFPWFGAPRPGKRKHGTLRYADWKVVTLDDSGDVAELVVAPRLTAGSEPTDGLTATLRVAVSEILELDLQVHNPTTVERSYDVALHPYFRVGDIRDVVLVDAATGAAMTSAAMESGVSTILDGPLDAEIVDRGLGRIIRVSSSCPNVVVWNPGPDVLVGHDAGAWRSFLCVEPAFLGGSLVLAPGATQHTQLAVSVRGLNEGAAND